jgi:RNA recognition motif-containing protein
LVKVFVSGIPFEVGEQELAQRFAEFNVLEATIVRNPGNGSRGYGWVYLKEMRSALCSIQALNGSPWSNRILRVELAREPGARRPRPANHQNTVFCGNLPYAVTEEDLRECFSQYGEVLRSTVVMDREGRSRGFGFVEMAEVAAAELAAADLHGRDWLGRPLTVRMRSGAQP